MNEELWEKYHSHMLNEGVTQRRINKLLTMFNAVNRGLNKDLKKATREEIEAFLGRLHRNQFKKENGAPYSGSTKSDIKKFLKQFYKWLLGEGEYYPKQVSWIKTRISKDEKPEEKETLSFKEIVTLSNAFSQPQYKALVLMLFDSGFRIGEMMSVKKKNLTWEQYDEKNKCFWINCNESKTITRKIPIPLFTEDIKAFTKTAYYQALEDDDLLFPMSYNAIRKALRQASTKARGKPISPHSLRHSSATYYSKVYDGNMNLIGERYGWSFDSKELKTYIRRSGAYQKAGVKKVYDNQISKIKEEMTAMREENHQLEDEVKRLTSVINTMMEAPGFEKLFKTSHKISKARKKK